MKMLTRVAASDSDLFPLRRGKIKMGVLKQNLRSPLPCLPRQGKELGARCRSPFSPRLAPTIFEGEHEVQKLKNSFLILRVLRALRGEIIFACRLSSLESLRRKMYARCESPETRN